MSSGRRGSRLRARGLRGVVAGSPRTSTSGALPPTCSGAAGGRGSGLQVRAAAPRARRTPPLLELLHRHEVAVDRRPGEHGGEARGARR